MTEKGSGREVVAIDGPSGSGKSSVARSLAARLGWRHLDTGALYRAVTWFVLQRGHKGVESAAELEGLALRLADDGGVWIGERDVTGLLRSAEVEASVSAVSAVRPVREAMVELQREIASKGPLVAEGRDMASVVFPDARWKFYIDARLEERARRRLQDHRRQGREVAREEVEAEIRERDRLDTTREDSPLRCVPEAVRIDSSDLTLEEVVERIARVMRADSSG
ncbi:MAG: (d)CMP kinase [Planctomycetota bacterium]